MKTSLLLLTLALATCAAAQQTPQDASKAFSQALLNKDAATLNRLASDHLTVVWSDGEVYNRGEVLDIAREGHLQKYTPYWVRVLPVDQDSAIVTYDCIIQMPEGDSGLAPRYQHVSELWVKQGADWKLQFEQFTPARPAD